MSCPQSWLFLCPRSISVQEILANTPTSPGNPLFSLSHYFPAIATAGIDKPSGFITEARDSQMIVREKLEGVMALGLCGKLPLDITVLAGPVRCSRCCHPPSLGSSDERRQ